MSIKVIFREKFYGPAVFSSVVTKYTEIIKN